MDQIKQRQISQFQIIQIINPQNQSNRNLHFDHHRHYRTQQQMSQQIPSHYASYTRYTQLQRQPSRQKNEQLGQVAPYSQYFQNLVTAYQLAPLVLAQAHRIFTALLQFIPNGSQSSMSRSSNHSTGNNNPNAPNSKNRISKSIAIGQQQIQMQMMAQISILISQCSQEVTDMEGNAVSNIGLCFTRIIGNNINQNHDNYKIRKIIQRLGNLLPCVADSLVPGYKIAQIRDYVQQIQHMYEVMDKFQHFLQQLDLQLDLSLTNAKLTSSIQGSAIQPENNQCGYKPTFIQLIWMLYIDCLHQHNITGYNINLLASSLYFSIRYSLDYIYPLNLQNIRKGQKRQLISKILQMLINGLDIQDIETYKQQAQLFDNYVDELIQAGVLKSATLGVFTNQLDSSSQQQFQQQYSSSQYSQHSSSPCPQMNFFQPTVIYSNLRQLQNKYQKCLSPQNIDYRVMRRNNLVMLIQPMHKYNKFKYHNPKNPQGIKLNNIKNMKHKTKNREQYAKKMIQHNNNNNNKNLKHKSGIVNKNLIKSLKLKDNSSNKNLCVSASNSNGKLIFDRNVLKQYKSHRILDYGDQDNCNKENDDYNINSGVRNNNPEQFQRKKPVSLNLKKIEGFSRFEHHSQVHDHQLYLFIRSLMGPMRQQSISQFKLELFNISAFDETNKELRKIYQATALQLSPNHRQKMKQTVQQLHEGLYSRILQQIQQQSESHLITQQNRKIISNCVTALSIYLSNALYTGQMSIMPYASSIQQNPIQFWYCLYYLQQVHTQPLPLCVKDQILWINQKIIVQDIFRTQDYLDQLAQLAANYPKNALIQNISLCLIEYIQNFISKFIDYFEHNQPQTNNKNRELQQYWYNCIKYLLSASGDILIGKHLDQILLCSLYISAKIVGKQLFFVHIRDIYATIVNLNAIQNHIANTQAFVQDIFNKVVKTQYNTNEDIIYFYNSEFIQTVKPFIPYMANPSLGLLNPIFQRQIVFHQDQEYSVQSNEREYSQYHSNLQQTQKPKAPGSKTTVSQNQHSLRQIKCFSQLNVNRSKTQSIGIQVVPQRNQTRARIRPNNFITELKLCETQKIKYGDKYQQD